MWLVRWHGEDNKHVLQLWWFGLSRRTAASVEDVLPLQRDWRPDGRRQVGELHRLQWRSSIL